jgi:hypothetical protein
MERRGYFAVIPVKRTNFQELAIPAAPKISRPSEIGINGRTRRTGRGGEQFITNKQLRIFPEQPIFHVLTIKTVQRELPTNRRKDSDSTIG